MGKSRRRQQRQPLTRRSAGSAERLPEPRRDVRADVADELETIARDRAALERRQGDVVRRGRADGMTWAELGRLLGVTGQAVSMRYGRPPARCHFEGQRDYCEGVAVAGRGRVQLCRECDSRASSLTRLPRQPARTAGA